MNILVIPDLHCPFEHKDAVEFLKAVKKRVKPDKVVNLGDEADFCQVSKWAKDPDGMSAKDEYHLLIEHLQPFYKLFPKTFVCTSNHTARPFRLAFDAGLPQEFIKPYRELLKAPTGWKWQDTWSFDGILFQHGEGYNLNTRLAATSKMENFCYGHTHQSSVTYITNEHRTIWGFNVGCLIDLKSYAFNYSKNNKYKVTLGCGVIVNGTPHFIPMNLNKHNRWDRKVNF